MSKWTDCNGLGTVQYDFTPTGNFQISLKQGDRVEVLKESSGWFKGHLANQPEVSGIFPVSYVQLDEGASIVPLATPAVTETTEPAPSPRITTTSKHAPPPIRKKHALPGETLQTSSSFSNLASPTSPASPASPVSPAAAAASSPTSTSVAPSGSASGTAASALPTSSANPGSPNSPAVAAPVSGGGSPSLNTLSISSPNSTDIRGSIKQSQGTVVGPPGLPASAPPGGKALPPLKKEESIDMEKGPGPPDMSKALTLPKSPKPGSSGMNRFLRHSTANSGMFAASTTKDTAKDKDKDKSSLDENTTAKLKPDISAEALMVEIEHSMKEWATLLKSHLQSGSDAAYHQLKSACAALLDMRRRMMSPNTPEDKRNQTKKDIIGLIESNRQTLEGFMVPRSKDGQVADQSNTAIMELLDLHRVMYKTLNEEHSRAAAQRDAVVAPGWPPGPLQLLLDVKMCIFSVGESTELYLSLYSRQRDRFITEDYALMITAAGMPEDLRLLGKMTTIFQDLTAEDFNSDLWLVCRIFRNGRLLFDPKQKKAPPRAFRRPFGCAATCLSNVGLDKMVGQEYQPPNAAMTIYTLLNEHAFSKSHEMVIAGDKILEPAPRAKGIALGLVLHHGDLPSVRAKDPKLNAADVPSTNKLWFPEIMNPLESRHDLYCTIRTGHFLQEKNNALSVGGGRSVEVLGYVLNASGQVMQNVIFRGSGDHAPVSKYSTAVYYHTNTPVWDERIKIRLDPQQFEKCHLFFSFWHASAKKNTSAFAFSFLKLSTETGAAIPDDNYSLQTFKAFPKMEEAGSFAPWYLGIGEPPAGEKLTPRRESFNLVTTLCSTRKTQNAVLHSLLKWRVGDDSESTKRMLTKFTQDLTDQHASELAKFCREVLDVLTSILSSQQPEPVNEHAFMALLHCVEVLLFSKQDRVLDLYISSLFSNSTVYKLLLKLCINKLVEAKTRPDLTSSKLAKGMKYVIRLIMASYRSAASTTGAPDTPLPQFNALLLQVLEGMAAAVSSEMAPEDTATALITNFSLCLKDLTGTLSAKDIGISAKNFLEAITGRNLDRLVLLRNLLEDFEEEPDARSVLLPVGGQVLDASLQFLNDVFTAPPSREVPLPLPSPTVSPAPSLSSSPPSPSPTSGHHSGMSGTIAVPGTLVHQPTIVSPGPLVHHPTIAPGTVAHQPGPALASLASANNLYSASSQDLLRANGRASPNALSIQVTQAPPSPSPVSGITARLPEVLLCLYVLQKFLAIIQRHNLDTSDLGLVGIFQQLIPFVLQIQQMSGVMELNRYKAPAHLNIPKIDPLPDSTTILWTLTLVVKQDHIAALFARVELSALETLVVSLMEVCKSSLDLNVYPQMWTVMNMLQLGQIARLANLVCKPITNRLSVDKWRPAVWTRYFDLILALVTTEGLQLHSFSQKKRKFIEDRFGDLRVVLAKEMGSMWASLTPHRKVDFTSHLTIKLFDLVVKPMDELRALALDIYFDMMQSEWKESGEFTRVERHVVDAIYQRAHLAREAGSAFTAVIYPGLKDKVDKSPELRKSGTDFLNHLHRMAELMTSLLQFPDTPLYEDERTSVALKLMSYLETQSGRKEMYTRYAQFLVDLHASLKNYIEAGLTQLMQINKLTWSDNFLGSERERDRRERLHKSAIAYFTQGEDYERAVEQCEELKEYYLHIIYDFDKLSQILMQEANFYKQIGSTERFYSNYFRVVFYGKGFPDDLRKEFVYRGAKLEAVMDFTNRMKRKYPEARILMSSDPPREEDLATNNQIIGITTLTRPSEETRESLIRDLEKRGPAGGSAGGAPAGTGGVTGTGGSVAAPAMGALRNKPPTNVTRYRDNDNLRVFEYSKGVQRAKEDKPENEFKDLWVVRTYIFISESFPSVCRRLEVVDRKEEQIAPVANAVETITNKNDELRDKIDQARRALKSGLGMGVAPDMGPLSMNLNGVIDAAVNGGTKKYIEAFLTQDFVTLHPDLVGYQEKLKQVLRDQIDVLQEGLDVFTAHCDEKLKALAAHLSGFFTQMKTSMLPLLS